MRRTITPEMNCIDVGCHLGSVLHEITQLSPNGHHIAVEPIPDKVVSLRRRFPTVELHQIVLGEEDGTVEFFYDPRRSGFSSLGRHGHLGQGTTAISVKRKRLDDIIAPGKPIGFLKIDVEGAEFYVFRGARRVLSESRPVVLFECTSSLISPLGLTARQIFSFLTDEMRTISTCSRLGSPGGHLWTSWRLKHRWSIHSRHSTTLRSSNQGIRAKEKTVLGTAR